MHQEYVVTVGHEQAQPLDGRSVPQPVNSIIQPYLLRLHFDETHRLLIARIELHNKSDNDAVVVATETLRPSGEFKNTLRLSRIAGDILEIDLSMKRPVRPEIEVSEGPVGPDQPFTIMLPRRQVVAFSIAVGLPLVSDDEQENVLLNRGASFNGVQVVIGCSLERTTDFVDRMQKEGVLRQDADGWEIAELIHEKWQKQARSGISRMPIKVQ